MRWHFLAILATTALAGFIVIFSTGSAVVINKPAATSTFAVVPSAPLPPLKLPNLAATSSVATPAPKKPVAPATSATVSSAKAVQSPTPTSPPTQSVVSVGDLSTAADRLRAALVNILCLVPAGSGYQSISGSGVFISPSGYILTNAHVAQYFLLADRGVDCTIRTGSPAQNAYEAELAFISPAWINANPNVLTETTPTGDGEYDFAILAVTKSATASPLPVSFPSVSLGVSAPQASEGVVIAAYAAQFLQSSQIESALSPTIVYGSIKQVYTFGTNTIDVVSLGGSAAAQEGSSGGGVIDAQDNLEATISTTSTEPNTADRDLNAITAPYIRREYFNESGISLDNLLAEPLQTAISNFAPQIPNLEAVITGSSK